MRPTSVQQSVLHPISIDYLPWPQLRNYLCLHQHRDARHNVWYYIQTIQFHWPAGKLLLCQSSKPDYHLNEEFEHVVSDIHNWGLDPRWEDTFPYLKKYIY